MEDAVVEAVDVVLVEDACADVVAHAPVLVDEVATPFVPGLADLQERTAAAIVRGDVNVILHDERRRNVALILGRPGVLPQDVARIGMHADEPAAGEDEDLQLIGDGRGNRITYPRPRYPRHATSRALCSSHAPSPTTPALCCRP